MRKLMWFSIGLGIANVMEAYILQGTHHFLALVALLAGISLVFLSRYMKNIRILAAILLGASLGFAWFNIYDGVILKPVRLLDGKIETISIDVADYSEETEQGSKVNGTIVYSGKTYQVLVYLNDKKVLSPGDRIDGTFRLRFTATGAEETQNYHSSDGVFLLAFESRDITISTPDHIPDKYFPAVWRFRILHRIDEIFPETGAGFAKALLLGERSGIDYETNTAFKVSGISHVIAVSGLHVSILFGLIYLLVGKNRLLSCVIGIPVLIIFAAIAGFSPSIVRACVMHALMLIAALFDKDYDPPTSLAFAALVMMLWNPLCITNIGFQLSVGCMIGIFLFSKRIHDWLLDEKRLGSGKGRGILPRLKRWFSGSVSVSISASVVTIPLVALHFDTVSLISPLTNLLVLWAISFIFYGIILACVISLFSMYAGMICAWFVTLPILLVTDIAKILSRVPYAAIYTYNPYIVGWLVGTYVMLAAFLCLKKKKVIPLGVFTLLSLAVALTISWVEPRLDPCRVTALNVGQGQCILLQSKGRTYLVDCGGDSDENSADIAAQTLLTQGIRHLDGVIVTHFDRDHAGGIPLLLTRIETDAVFLPAMEDDTGLREEIENIAGDCVQRIESDYKLEINGICMTLFGSEGLNSDNENSLCILFQSNDCDILITGDRGTLGEKLLLHRTELPKLEVLIAGHHGSAGSTGEDLLLKTRPEYVFISAGQNNRYGHPSPALLQRLEKYGCIIYRTDLFGTVMYRG